MAGVVILACSLQGSAAAQPQAQRIASPGASSGVDAAPTSDLVLERALGAEVERYREADRVAPATACT